MSEQQTPENPFPRPSQLDELITGFSPANKISVRTHQTVSERFETARDDMPMPVVEFATSAEYEETKKAFEKRIDRRKKYGFLAVFGDGTLNMMVQIVDDLELHDNVAFVPYRGGSHINLANSLMEQNLDFKLPDYLFYKDGHSRIEQFTPMHTTITDENGRVAVDRVAVGILGIGASSSIYKVDSPKHRSGLSGWLRALSIGDFTLHREIIDGAVVAKGILMDSEPFSAVIGEQPDEEEFSGIDISFLNLRHAAGGAVVSPQAESDEGFICATAKSRTDLFRSLYLLRRGKYPASLLTTAKVKMSPDSYTYVHLDGETRNFDGQFMLAGYDSTIEVGRAQPIYIVRNGIKEEPVDTTV